VGGVRVAGVLFWSFSSGELELSRKLLAAAADLDCMGLLSLVQLAQLAL